MPTAMSGRQNPSASPGSTGLLGLRPLPALSALAVALASVWVVTTAGDGDPAGISAAGGGRPPVTAGPDAGTPGIPAPRTTASAAANGPAAPVMAGLSGHYEPGAQAGPARSNPVPGSAPVNARGVPPPADAGPQAGADTMYLTIVGDQTVVSWGPAGRRTARIDDLLARARRTSPVADTGAGDAYGDNPEGSETGGGQASAGDAPEIDVGPEPQQCPRTLPPGSTQADADQLQALYSCRYLSGCSVDDGACTFFYQGRG